jgi:hypothetical protein
MKNVASRRWLAVLTGLALASPVVADFSPDPAAAADPAPTAAVALVLHLEGSPTPELPADATALRQAIHGVLAALTDAAGTVVSDRALTEDLVRRHRIRTGGTLTSAFLAEVHDGLGALTLLSVALLVDNGQLAASIRAVDTATGRVMAVGVAEAAIDGGDWHRTLIDVLRRAFPTTVPALEPAPALLVLPGRGVGLDQQAARAATNCVLDAALKDGRWMIVDPALVNATAAASGRDLGRLGAEGRAALIRQFGTHWAIVPEVVSFGFTAAPSNLRAPEGDVTNSRRAAAEELVLTLQLVDLRTGIVVGTRSQNASGERGSGWFGLTEPQTLLGQIRESATALWPDFHRILEDATS